MQKFAAHVIQINYLSSLNICWLNTKQASYIKYSKREVCMIWHVSAKGAGKTEKMPCNARHELGVLSTMNSENSELELKIWWISGAKYKLPSFEEKNYKETKHAVSFSTPHC